jgi:gamma-glutamyltranspeptidase/glutathione hydrolase
LPHKSKEGFEFNSRRSPVMSCGGMLSSSQAAATKAGLDMLDAGGTAADAAVAAAAALAATEPMSTGIGGDAFALFYEAGTGKVSAINGSGRSPRALTLEVIETQGLGQGLPPDHPHTVTVPGAPACWFDLVERFGRLSMGQILSPAIRLAQEGFPVAPLAAHAWQAASRRAESSPGLSELLIDGRPPRAGEVFRNPGLARALDKLALGGKRVFYMGEIAEAVVAEIERAGGLMTAEDLAGHESEWVDPIDTMYRGLRVWECPPNGQGLAALLALNLLRGFDLDFLAPLGGQRLHLIVEALRLAFADAFWYAADPAVSSIPLKELLSEDYARQRRERIDPYRAMVAPARGAPPSSSDTVYLSAVDGQGNACSFINSLYECFGSGIVPRGWGFPLQNRGLNFRLEPDHPNALAPGKRPYHTIIPAMATREDGSLYASFGVMGGFMQPQGQVQVVVALWDDGLDPQGALDRPRVCLLGDYGLTAGELAVEQGISVQAMGELVRRGHRIRPVRGFDRSVFGRGQIIVRDSESGVLSGGSDPRADGCALGTV